MSKVYPNASITIALDAGADVTQATSLGILVTRPDGTTTTWPATAQAPTVAAYSTVPGDLAQTGTYLLQVAYGMGASTPNYGDVFDLAVSPLGT